MRSMLEEYLYNCQFILLGNDLFNILKIESTTPFLLQYVKLKIRLPDNMTSVHGATKNVIDSNFLVSMDKHSGVF